MSKPSLTVYNRQWSLDYLKYMTCIIHMNRPRSTLLQKKRLCGHLTPPPPLLVAIFVCPRVNMYQSKRKYALTGLKQLYSHLLGNWNKWNENEVGHKTDTVLKLFRCKAECIISFIFIGHYQSLEKLDKTIRDDISDHYFVDGSMPSVWVTSSSQLPPTSFWG